MVVVITFPAKSCVPVPLFPVQYCAPAFVNAGSLYEVHTNTSGNISTSGKGETIKLKLVITKQLGFEIFCNRTHNVVLADNNWLLEFKVILLVLLFAPVSEE